MTWPAGHMSKQKSLLCYLFGCQDIGALNVSMHNSLVVQIGQTLQHLSYVYCYKGLWKGTKLGWLDDAGQRSILHKLQYNVQVRPCLERTQILHNVLVIEVLEQLNFAHYALKVFLRNAAQGHLFDRNSISSSGVESLVDLTIRAPA